MPPSWKAMYAWIQSALMTCRSLEDFCQQAIAQIAMTYDAEGWLWIGIDMPDLQVYHSHHQDTLDSVLQPPFEPESNQVLPLKSTRLANGDLVVCLGHPQESPPHEPRFAQAIAVQLQRRNTMVAEAGGTTSGLATDNQAKSARHGWSADELDTLEILISQIGLAYELLAVRHRASLSRQRIALLSRTAYMLNSNLPLETQLAQLLNDLGTSMGSDRGVVLWRREHVLSALATWNMDVIEPVVQTVESKESLWQEVIDLFEEGAASHLEVSSPDAQAPTSRLQDWLVSQGCASSVLTPIHIRGQFLGMVGLLSTTSRQEYSVDELQILRQVTEQLAIALASLCYPVESLSEAWRPADAQRDDLTGCETRAVLDQTLSHILTELAVTDTSVILCDLDYFKLINDMYSHSVGDQVLRTVATRIRDQLRHGTKVYRYGGEEFAVLLNDTPQAAALHVAERLRWSISESPIKTSAGDVSITASFGVAQQMPTDNDGWTMFRRAEAAVENAKRKGRNQVIG